MACRFRRGSPFQSWRQKVGTVYVIQSACLKMGTHQHRFNLLRLRVVSGKTAGDKRIEKSSQKTVLAFCELFRGLYQRQVYQILTRFSGSRYIASVA